MAKNKGQQINIKNHSHEEIQDIIVNALLQYDEKKKVKDQESKEKTEIKKNNKPTVLQGIKVFLKTCGYAIPFSKWQKDIEEKTGDTRNTLIVIKAITSMIFALFSFLLFCIAIILIKEMISYMKIKDCIKVALCVVFVLSSLLFSGLFKCISKEVDKSEDFNYVSSIFSIIIALASLFASIAALKH